MKQELMSQYRAALKMLTNTIDQCPDHLWTDVRYHSAYWQIVYHSLHFTALYLSKNEAGFTPWSNHIPGIHKLGRLSSQELDTTEGSYSKSDMQAYAAKIGLALEDKIDEQSLAEPSGFEWLPMNKLELHFYNIRHIQHHTGQLIERLHQNGVTRIDWIGRMDKL